jgi:hypothetical protein
MSNDKTMDLDFTALQVAENLHGLTFAEAETVLDKVRVLLSVSHRVDTRGEEFRKQLDAFTAYYEDRLDVKHGAH